jgi:hypothetical protein
MGRNGRSGSRICVPADYFEKRQQETQSRLHGDRDDDIRAYYADHVHMLIFSDLLSNGVARQFPQTFAGY